MVPRLLRTTLTFPTGVWVTNPVPGGA